MEVVFGGPILGPNTVIVIVAATVILARTWIPVGGKRTMGAVIGTRMVVNQLLKLTTVRTGMTTKLLQMTTLNALTRVILITMAVLGDMRQTILQWGNLHLGGHQHSNHQRGNHVRGYYGRRGASGCG